MSNLFEIPVWLNLDLSVGISEQNIIENNRCIPNPFTHSTDIQFALKQAAITSVDVYNSQGTVVSTVLSSGRLLKGNNSIRWDGKNNEGRKVPGGLYYYRIMAGSNIISGKVLLHQ